jgi:hypothetical protein
LHKYELARNAIGVENVVAVPANDLARVAHSFLPTIRVFKRLNIFEDITEHYCLHTANLCRTYYSDAGKAGMNPDTTAQVRTVVLVAIFAIAICPRTCAQHAADNVVVSAEDAFGLTIGPQTVGLYDSAQIRGFSPQLAGNLRIDGLYFDQQAPPSNRILEDSTIRVGISAQGYAFPAPTGIVEYELRHVNDIQGLTAVIYSGPFGTVGLDLDAQVPIDTINLRVPVGVSYRTRYVSPSYATPGATSTVVTYGAAPQ